MTDTEYVKIYCCADCAHYDMKKHRCRNGAKDEGTGREHFYRDCRLGIHNENESIPIEVLQEIRQEINKAIDCIPITFSRNDADDCLKRDIKDIFDKYIKEIEG